MVCLGNSLCSNGILDFFPYKLISATLFYFIFLGNFFHFLSLRKYDIVKILQLSSSFCLNKVSCMFCKFAQFNPLNTFIRIYNVNIFMCTDKIHTHRHNAMKTDRNPTKKKRTQNISTIYCSPFQISFVFSRLLIESMLKMKRNQRNIYIYEYIELNMRQKEINNK